MSNKLHLILSVQNNMDASTLRIHSHTRGSHTRPLFFLTHLIVNCTFLPDEKVSRLDFQSWETQYNETIIYQLLLIDRH